MTPLVPAAIAALAAAAAFARPPRLLPRPAAAPTAAARARPALRLSPRTAAVAAALAGWAFAGPRAGPAVAAALAFGTHRLLTGLPSRAAADRERACAAAAPLLADLLAACVAAGASVDAALDAATTAVGGPLADDVAAAARAQRLGVPARAAWAALLAPERPPPVRALARAVVRSGESGAAPAAVLRAVADDARAAARTAGEVAARRAGVLAVLPLGACFLPAFVLVGIVPLVAALVGRLAL